MFSGNLTVIKVIKKDTPPTIHQQHVLAELNRYCINLTLI